MYTFQLFFLCIFQVEYFIRCMLISRSVRCKYRCLLFFLFQVLLLLLYVLVIDSNWKSLNKLSKVRFLCLSNPKVLGTIWEGMMDFSFCLVTNNLMLRGFWVWEGCAVILLNDKPVQHKYLLWSHTPEQAWLQTPPVLLIFVKRDWC